MPYYGRQPGIFEKLVTGANTVLNIANAVQSWKNQGTLQEGRELEGIANRLKIAQTIAPNQPVSLNEGLGSKIEKLGIPVPKLTPERVAQAQDVSVAQAPGSITLPTAQSIEGGVNVSTGGRATPIAEVQRREAQGKSIAESLGPIGGYAPIMPEPTRIGVLGRGGGVKVETLPPGVKKVMSEPTPATTYGLYDQEQGIIPTGNMRVTPLKKEKTPEQLRQEAQAKAEGRWAGTPEVEERDPETNLPVATHKRKPFFAKSEGANVPVMTEEEANRAGKVPKGTRIIKRGESDYKIFDQSRKEANKIAEKNPMLNIPGSEKEREAFVNTETNRIFNERKKVSKGGGGQEQSEAPPANLLKEGHQTTFKNGQVWSLQGGKTVRLQ